MKSWLSLFADGAKTSLGLIITFDPLLPSRKDCSTPVPSLFFIAERTEDHHVQFSSAEIVSIIRSQQIGNGRGPRNPPIHNILHLYRKTSSCNLFPQADRQKLGALKSGIGILIGRVQEKGESQYHLCCFDKVNVFMDISQKEDPFVFISHPSAFPLKCVQANSCTSEREVCKNGLCSTQEAAEK